VFARLPDVELVGDGEGGRARLRLRGQRRAAVVRALVEAGVDVDALLPVTGGGSAGASRLEDVFLARTRAMESAP
jgi:hypothetical protein